jgi:hypothetical protein
MLLALLALFASCALIDPARRQRADQLETCKMVLPVLRAEPAWPYRVVQLVSAYNETDLAWYACAENADAVISTYDGERRTPIFLGKAIKYERGRPQPALLPSPPVPTTSPPQGRQESPDTQGFDVGCRFGISGCEAQAADACGNRGFHVISSHRTEEAASGTPHFDMKAACGPVPRPNVQNPPARTGPPQPAAGSAVPAP